MRIPTWIYFLCFLQATIFADANPLHLQDPEIAKTPYYTSQLAGTTAGYLVYDRGAILDGAVDIYDLGASFIDDPCFRAPSGMLRGVLDDLILDY